MGATTFFQRSSGKSAQAAFRDAVTEAQYEHGHGGYTGSIAEKSSFTMIKVPEGMEPYDYAEHLIHKADKRVDDKYGPAGCLDLGGGEFLFFGWASE